jgi:hypothetical protein
MCPPEGLENTPFSRGTKRILLKALIVCTKVSSWSLPWSQDNFDFADLQTLSHTNGGKLTKITLLLRDVGRSENLGGGQL